ncbi:MAG: hypothetical protein ACRC1K_23190 [Planctomycetia bacterium]
MGNHVKGCSCRRCRAGMHTKFGGWLLKRLARRIRRAAKQLLRRGEEPPPCVSRGWTD